MRNFFKPFYSLFTYSIGFLAVTVLFSVTVYAELQLDEITSDELPAVRCSSGQHVSGMKCMESYCDKVSISCNSFFYNETGNRFNTPWVENNGQKIAECANRAGPTGGRRYARTAVMVGIGCSGDYCDNIQLECANLRDFKPDLNNCLPTIRDFSEERGRNLINLARNQAIVSIKCSGQHCDNKEVKICNLIPR